MLAKQSGPPPRASAVDHAPDDERAPIGSDASDAPDADRVTTSLEDWDALGRPREFEREREPVTSPVSSRGGLARGSTRSSALEIGVGPLGTHAWRSCAVGGAGRAVDRPAGPKSWDEGFRALERWAEATNGGKDYNAPNACVHDSRVGTWLVTQRIRQRGRRAV